MHLVLRYVAVQRNAARDFTNKNKEIRLMNDLLHFDKMITPQIITFIYWLGLLFAVIGGLGVMFSQGLSIGSFVGGILAALLFALGARIWCELLIVLFKMNEALQDLRNK
jgi:hypothetical protein